MARLLHKFNIYILYLQDMTSDTSASLSISVTELTKTYGKVFALNRVSIDVKAGEFLTLLGHQVLAKPRC